jgi:hypothetical protein
MYVPWIQELFQYDVAGGVSADGIHSSGDGQRVYDTIHFSHVYRYQMYRVKHGYTDYSL